MSRSWRKPVGVIGLLVYLTAYIALAVTLAGFLPGHALAQAPYYLVAGVAWAFPLKPLIAWMNRG